MDVAERIASALVSSRKAACVNIVPGVVSVYTWKGKVEKDSELLLMIKTRQEHVAALTDLVKSLHPYEVPEVIALPIEGGSPGYLRWVQETTSDHDGDAKEMRPDPNSVV